VDRPVDLNLTLKRVYNISAHSDDGDGDNIDIDSKGTFSALVDLDCEGRIVYNNGKKTYIGKAEFIDVLVKANLT